MTAKGGHGEGKCFLRPGVVDSCCRGSNSMIVVTVEQKRSRVKQRDRRRRRLDLIDQDGFIIRNSDTTVPITQRLWKKSASTTVVRNGQRT